MGLQTIHMARFVGHAVVIHCGETSGNMLPMDHCFLNCLTLYSRHVLKRHLFFSRDDPLAKIVQCTKKRKRPQKWEV